MKKIALTLAAIVLTITSFAASNTQRAFITMQASGATDVKVKLYANPDYTSAFDNGYDVSWNKNTEAGTINIYAAAACGNLEMMVSDAIDGTPICITTNSATTYKFVFSSITGVVKLYDAVEDSVIIMENSGEYAFTAAANATITDRFKIGDKPAKIYTRTVTNGSWGTLCLPYASTKVEGATIFTVGGKDNATDPTGIYLLDYTSNLVAGTPYVFQATATELKVTLTGDSVDATSANGLIGSYVEETIAAGMYIIDGDKLKNTDGTCKVRANGAYFDIANMSVYTPSGAPGRFMGIRGAATDVEEIEASDMKDGKMMIDGKLVIIKGGKMFNAQGAQL